MIIQIQFKNKALGFSLVEMAVVLVILGFVLGALILPLQAQRSQAFQLQTENTLEQAKKSLLGYAVSRGRLPCPATATSNVDAGSRGLESPIPVTGICTNVAGYLPAATLGIQPTDEFGFALDAWSNRIRYVITQAPRAGSPTPDFTTSGGMSNVGVSAVPPLALVSDLKICSDNTAANCSVSNYLTNNAVAVVFSTGSSFVDANFDGYGDNDGADETANLNATINFYSRVPTSKESINGAFDDMVIWISPYVLYNAMIEAGQLH